MSQYFDNKQLFASPKVDQYNNHMVMTNVCKPVKTKYVFIDTKFCDDLLNNRLNPSSPDYNLCNYNFSLSERIVDIKSITVVEAQIPMSMYNISSAQENNFFMVSTDISNIMIIIPDGQYNIETLSDVINSQLNLINTPSRTLRYGSFPNNTSFFYAYSLTDFTIHFAVDKNGNFDKYNFKSKLGWLLGFRKKDYTIKNVDPILLNLVNNIPTTQKQLINISEATINLHVFRYLFLALDEFVNGNQNSCISLLPKSIINKNIIAKICIDNNFYPYGTILNVNVNTGLLTSDTRVYTGNKVDIQKLNIQLLDDIGNPIKLNGDDFSFGLKIEHD